MHELKSELSPKIYLKEASSIDMTYSDIKSAGLDKLDNILKKKDKSKIKINKNDYSASEPTGIIIWVKPRGVGEAICLISLNNCINVTS